TSLAMSGATEDDSGLASGLVNTTQQIGPAFGLAVLATLAAARTASMLSHGQGEPVALVGGYRLAFGVGAALVVAALAVATLVLKQREDRHNFGLRAAAETVPRSEERAERLKRCRAARNERSGAVQAALKREAPRERRS